MKQSFFKLPLILATVYWLTTSLLNIVFIIFNDSNMVLPADVVDIIFNSLFYLLPEVLFIIFVSCITFYRFHIHCLTVKNIVLSVIIIVILCVVMFLIYQFIFSSFIMYWFENYSYSESLFWIIYSGVTMLFSYSLIGFVIYYGIAALSPIFNHTDMNISIFEDYSSSKIHLFLFLILFMMLSLVLLEFLYLFFYSFRYDDSERIIYLFAIFITVVILYFVLRRSFNYEFQTIEVCRVIKSVLLSYILSIIINIIIGIGLSLLIALIVQDYYYGYRSTILVFLLVGAILQFVISCLIMRMMTNRYFSRVYVGYSDTTTS